VAFEESLCRELWQGDSCDERYQYRPLPEGTADCIQLSGGDCSGFDGWGNRLDGQEACDVDPGSDG
jgi:hypothetical protein